jgi:hypothetical protein
MFRLHTKQLLAEYIILLAYTTLSSPSEFPDGFIEPLFGSAATPLMDNLLFSFLVTGEAP